MKKHLLTVFIAFLTLTHAAIADVTKKPLTPRLTNGHVQVTPVQSDTNLDSAERLSNAIDRVRKDGEKIGELLGSLDDMVRLLDSAEKEMAMLEGTTNFVEIIYPSSGGKLTMMLINPFMSKGDSNAVEGRFYFLYPKEWKVSNSFCGSEKGKTIPSTCGAVYTSGSGTNQNLWHLNLRKPFESLRPADREKIKTEFRKLTTVPLDKLRFDPRTSPPIWIADFGKEETVETEKK